MKSNREEDLAAFIPKDTMMVQPNIFMLPSKNKNMIVNKKNKNKW